MAQPTFIDHYQTLNIAPSASSEQIRAAYIRLAKKQHPDIGGSQLAMRHLNQAYAVLRDELNRQQYDISYRKTVLHEKVNDIFFSDSEDWDLSDVDEFLAQVYHEDRRRQWQNPLFMGVTVVSLCLLLFIILAISHQMTSIQSVQAITPPITSKDNR